MKKLFWVAVGIGIGVLATRQLARVRTAVPIASADSARGRIGSLLQGASSAFREGMTAREAELRAALGVEQAPRGRHADVVRD